MIDICHERSRKPTAPGDSVPGVAALCTPSDPVLTLATVEAAGRFEPMGEDEQLAAMRATASEEHIFPMPAG